VTDDEVVHRLLTRTTTWAVVGLSDNQRRAAYGVAAFLQRHGKRILPVHPKAAHTPFEVHGERGYACLADLPEVPDVVDVFVRSELAGDVADQAVAVGASGVWFQLGVVDPAAYQRVRAAGVDMVMDRCPVIEWPRLGH
jgi:predicted CoA-binding protein